MRDFCFYVLYRAGSAFLAALPLPLLFRLGEFAGFCAWLVLPHYRRLALRNMVVAFAPAQSRSALRKLVRRHFQRLGANLLCSVKVAAMPLEALEKHVQFDNLDAVHAHLRAGQPVVAILSHLGNWEIFSQIWPRFFGYVRNSTIYQKLSNPYLDRHVRKMRARTGVEMFDRTDGFHKPIELLRAGGIIGILSDQHAGDQGVWVPFFGKLASTTPLPALLARRTKAALIVIGLHTEGLAQWRVTVEPALEASAYSAEALTAKANEALAAQIRRGPEDWFWVHDRWKTPRPNFLLNRYKRGVFLPKPMTPDTLKPFRILIRSSNWLGDAVMSVPAVRAIKQGRPDAHVTVAVPAKIAAIWKLVPEVDEIISLPRSSLGAMVRSLRRAGPFDVAILFPNSLRVALEAWLGGISRRVGYRGHRRSWLLNQIVRQRKSSQGRQIEHQTETYLRIARDAGAEVSPVPIQTAAPSMKANGSVIKIALCPGAEYGPAKRWLPERFAAAAAAISAGRPVQWILFGTANDAAAGAIVATALGENCLNRIGQTSLDELIEELRACRLLLTNDTGTMHLASLLGLPTVSVFGSTEPRMTAPLGDGHIILRHHVECSPCFLRECPIDFRCMTSVSTEEVVDAVASVLAR